MQSPQVFSIAGPVATAEAQRAQSDSSRRIRGPNWHPWFWRWIVRCSAVSRQRAALSSLDDRLLDDIGVTRQQANAEAAKPFWR